MAEENTEYCYMNLYDVLNEHEEEKEIGEKEKQ